MPPHFNPPKSGKQPVKDGLEAFPERGAQKPDPKKDTKAEKEALKAELTKETAEERRLAETIEVKTKATRGRTDVSLESLEQRAGLFDKETPALIGKISVSESPEKQRNALAALQDVSTVMIAAALFKSPQIEKQFVISNFTSVSFIKNIIASLKLEAAESVAINKLIEIVQKPGSPLYKHLEAEWPSWISCARAISKNLTPVVTGDYSLKPNDPKNESPGVKEWIKKQPVVQWAVKHPWYALGAALLGACVVGGAVKGISTLYNGGEKSDKKNGILEGGASKGIFAFLSAAALSILTFFTAGRILGSEKVLSFFRSKNIKIDENRVVAFAIHFSKGEWKKGMDVLLNGVDEHKELHEKYAGLIKEETKEEVSPALLFDLGGQKYGEFMDDSLHTVGASTIKKITGLMGIELPGMVKDMIDDNRKKIAVQKFFRDRRGQITALNLDPEATVDQVLIALDKGPVAATNPPATTQEAGATAPAVTPQQGNEPSGLQSLTASYATILHAADGAGVETIQLNQDILELYKKELMSDSEVELFVKIVDEKVEAAKEKVLREKDPRKQLEMKEELRAFNQNLEKFKERLKERQNALEAYAQAVKNHLSLEEIVAKAEVVFQAEADLRDEIEHLRAREGFWAMIGTLAIGGPQLVRFFQTHIGTGNYRTYGWYLGKQGVTAPFKSAAEKFGLLRNIKDSALVERLASKDFRLNRLKSRLTVLEQCKVAKQSTYDVLLADLKLTDDSFRSANLEATLRGLEPIGEAIKDDNAFKKRDLLEEVKARKEVEILKERVELTKTDPADTAKITRHKSAISQMEKERLLVESHEIQYRINGFHGDLDHRIEKKGKNLQISDFEEMDKIDNAVVKHQERIDRLMMEKFNELEQTKDVIVKNALTKELDELVRMRVRLVTDSIKGIDSMIKSVVVRWKALTGNLQKDVYQNAALTRFREDARTLMSKLCHNKGTKNPLLKVIPKSKGSLIFYAAAFTIGTAAGKDEFTGWKAAAGQAAFDIAPITGTYSDFYALLKGKEKITGREVEGFERWGLRPIFGVAGALSDLALIAGVGLLGRGALAGLKTGKAVAQGGKLMHVLEAAKAAKAAGKEESAIYKGVLSAEHSIGRRLMLTGLASGLTMTLVPMLTTQLSSETQEFLGDATKEIEDITEKDMPQVESMKQWLEQTKKSVDRAA